jgi:hypothetical protein
MIESNAQESGGHEIIKYRKWKGNEIVFDAGCGYGRTTKILSMKVPEGKVIAVVLICL